MRGKSRTPSIRDCSCGRAAASMVLVSGPSVAAGVRLSWLIEGVRLSWLIEFRAAGVRLSWLIDGKISATCWPCKNTKQI